MTLQQELQWYKDEGFGDLFAIEPVTDKKLIINVALTGMVPMKADTPHVPMTAQEIIDDVIKVYNLGASIVHLHSRDAEGLPSHETGVYEEAVPVIREKCPGLIVNLTTSGRTHNTFEYRSKVLNLTGPAKPDMASLTVGSLNFPKQASINAPDMIKGLATKMMEEGIKPELEIFETGMVNMAAYLHKKEIIKDPQWYIFLLGSLGTMPARLIDLDHLIATLPPNSIWGATGIGKFQLPINIAAILKGGHVRIGLEDNIWFDNERTTLATNEMFVQRLVDFAKSIGREIASPEETREILGIALNES